MGGNLSLAEGDVSKARGYFERSLMATADEDWRAQAQARKCTAQAYLVAGEVEEAIETLDEVLAVLSVSGEDGKSIKLLKAELWNAMARAYKTQGNLPQAINFAKLALHTY